MPQQIAPRSSREEENGNPWSAHLRQLFAWQLFGV
jgi:hypothetical protein